MNIPTKPKPNRTELFSVRTSAEFKDKLRAAREIVLPSGQRVDVIAHILSAAEAALDEILKAHNL